MKPHLIDDLFNPLLMACCLPVLIFFSVQMLIENEAMLAAQKNEVEEISCQELASSAGQCMRYVQLSGFQRDGEFSAFVDPKTKKYRVAFLVKSIDQDPLVANSYPIVIDKWAVVDNEVAEVVASGSLRGLLRNFMSLDDRHRQFLETKHPEIDFGDCYVLISRPPNGGLSVRYHAIVFILLLGSASIYFSISFIKNAWRARRGVRLVSEKVDLLQPQKHIADLSFEARPIQLQDRLQSGGINCGLQSSIDQSEAMKLRQIPKPDNWLLLKTLKAGSIVLPPVAVSLFLIPGIVPLGIDALLIVVAGVCLTITCFKYAAAVIEPKNDCRIRVTESSLSFMQRRYFNRQRPIAESNGFEYLTTEATNLAIGQPAQVYRSSDGAIMLQFITSVMGIRAIVFHSLLANGKVVMTIDMEVPEMRHPLLALTTGVKGNFISTLSIHRQILRSFSDVIVRVEHDEMDSLANYIDQLELLATGRIPLYEPEIPPFRDLIAKLNSTSEGDNRDMVNASAY